MTRGKKVLIGLVVLALLAGGATFAFFELTRTDRFLKDVTWNGPAGWSEAAIAAHREKIDYLVARVASEPAIRFSGGPGGQRARDPLRGRELDRVSRARPR